MRNTVVVKTLQDYLTSTEYTSDIASLMDKKNSEERWTWSKLTIFISQTNWKENQVVVLVNKLGLDVVRNLVLLLMIVCASTGLSLGLALPYLYSFALMTYRGYTLI